MGLTTPFYYNLTIIFTKQAYMAKILWISIKGAQKFENHVMHAEIEREPGTTDEKRGFLWDKLTLSL